MSGELPADRGAAPGADGAPKGTAPGTSPAPSPAPTGTPASAPPSSPSTSRPSYAPQFTAATQLILKRMKGETSSLSSALSAASATVAGTIKPSTYEDVRRRVVMNMATSASMTLQMPSTSSPTPKLSTADSIPMPRPSAQSAKSSGSAIRRISSGLTASGKVSTAKAPPAKASASESKPRKGKGAAALKATGPRRKRTKADDSGDSDSGLSNFVAEEPASSHSTPAAPRTMTKSGRQVLKPTTYNPAAMEAGTRKRTHYGKRTAEQALCKKCTRMQSPANNQMVFCDGCNDGWHQMCHDPWIENVVIHDQHRSWYCGICVEKRNRQQAKRQKVEAKSPVGPPPLESWASKLPQQRRAYLMTLPSQQLLELLTISLELHPDLPIFPGTPAVDSPRSLFAGSITDGLFPRADANPGGKMNNIRKGPSSTGSGKGRGRPQGQAEESQVKAEEEEEDDPLAALWPRAGRGLYSRLPPDTTDPERLVDDDDFESFSVIVYDDRGRKIEENGMKV